MSFQVRLLQSKAWSVILPVCHTSKTTQCGLPAACCCTFHLETTARVSHPPLLKPCSQFSVSSGNSAVNHAGGHCSNVAWTGTFSRAHSISVTILLTNWSYITNPIAWSTVATWRHRETQTPDNKPIKITCYTHILNAFICNLTKYIERWFSG